MEVESERGMGTFVVEKGPYGHPRKAAAARVRNYGHQCLEGVTRFSFHT